MFDQNLLSLSKNNIMVQNMDLCVEETLRRWEGERQYQK